HARARPVAPVAHRALRLVLEGRDRHEGPDLLPEPDHPGPVPDAALARFEALERLTVMDRLANPALFLGLAGVVAGFLLQNYRPSWPRVWPVLLVVGGLVLLFGLYASFASNVRRALAGRVTRYGLNAIVLIALILGVIVLVEAVSYRHSYRVDLTENRRWSLSPQSVKVVNELPTPVKAVAFFRPDQPTNATAEALPKHYARPPHAHSTL